MAVNHVLNKYTVPSWLPHMPADEYYSLTDRLGSSKLKAFAESPLHYHRFEQAEDTPAMRSGRMIHKAVLEQDEFFDDYVIKPDGIGNKNTKNYKAWLADLPKSEREKEVITETEFAQCAAMYEALKSSYAWSYFQSHGLAETSIIWEHKCENGFKIPCRGRLDYLVMQASKVDLIIDYKTCASADARKVMRNMTDYKYWLQEQHFTSGYRRCWHGERDARIMFVFQEKTAPYDVCAVIIDDESYEQGKMLYRDLLEDLAMCHIEKDFKGRNDRVLTWSFLN